jgi:hypothetical protein
MVYLPGENRAAVSVGTEVAGAAEHVAVEGRNAVFVAQVAVRDVFVDAAADEVGGCGASAALKR